MGHSAQERIRRLNSGVCIYAACRIGLFCRLRTVWPQDQASDVVQSCQKDQELVGIINLSIYFNVVQANLLFSTSGTKLLI